MNILSKNIWIDNKHFRPLLTDAVIDTLYLVFSPYAFFQRELNNPRNTHHKSDLLGGKKFIRVNAELYDAFLNKIRLSDKEKFSAEETTSLFNKVCEEISFQPEEPDVYIEKFSEIEPLYLQKIYKEIEKEPAKKKPDQSGRDPGFLF
jgi:hypothetical protein